MLTKPKYGWSTLTICDHYLFSFSYISDMPYDLIDAFIEFFESNKFYVEFNGEENVAALAIFDNRLFFITEQSCPPETIQGIEITNEMLKLPASASLNELMYYLAQLLAKDVVLYADDWAWWRAADTEEMVKEKEHLLDRLSDLKKYIERKKHGKD